MNTYSSVKSFDSQVQGRKMVEPNIAVMNSRNHHHSPKVQSPEQYLDQFTEKKQEIKVPKTKKMTQGLQGKTKTAKKPAQSLKKRSASPTKKTVKKKSHTVETKKKPHQQTVQKTKKLNEQQRRDQLGLGQLSDKQIKHLKKLQKTKESQTPQQQISSTIKKPNGAIKAYMIQKRKYDNQLNLQEKVVTQLEKQKKVQNLKKLNDDVKEIFKKKATEYSQPQTPKIKVIKKKKIKQHLHEEKAQELKQKFQEISKRFQIVQQEQEQEFEEQQFEQEQIENSEQSYNENQEDFQNQIISVLQQFEPSQYLLEKIQYILEEQGFNEVTEGEMQMLEFHFMNEAATMVQKVWRGYSFRKAFWADVHEMFQQEQQHEQEQNEQDEEEEEDNQVVIQKPNSPQNNQELYFYNPFNSVGENSIASDDQSVLQSSIIHQLQQELETYNCQIENIMKDKSPDPSNFLQMKQKMQNTILSLVQSHMKKSKDPKTHDRHDSELSVEKLRNMETHLEKNFNEARKKLQKHSMESEEKISLKESGDLNRSSLLSLQSQFMKRENELLHMREEAIQLRYRAELKKALSESERKEVEEWLVKELEDVKQTKLAIELSRKREATALKKIQRDILVAQTYDDAMNPDIQQLQQQIEEQFSNLKATKQQEPIKVVNQFNQDLQQMPETLSEELHVEERDDKYYGQNIIECDKQVEVYQTVSNLTNDILDDMITQLSDEILVKKDKFEYVIGNLVANQPEPGIRTNIQEIKQYISDFFAFAFQHHKDEILHNLNVPYGFTPEKRMQLIHGYEDDEDDDEQPYTDNRLAFVLDDGYFLQYEQYRLQQQNNNEASFAAKEMTHIHNKAIFDACNEALNQFRPFYIYSGAPYPWEKKPPGYVYKEEDIQQIMKEMETKVLQWAITFGGFLPVEDEDNLSQEKQVILEEKSHQMMLQQLHQLENPLLYDSQTQLQLDHVAQIRDERLYKMLINDIKDQEFRWFLFEDDRTEFLMELADNVFEYLVEEMAQEQI